MNWSRRRWCEAASRWIAISAVGPGRRLAFALSFDQAGEVPGGWARAGRCAYRADAVVTVFGVPIFSRRAVGSAVASIRERARGKQSTIALWFAGGSDPARTRGLHYAGSTEERVVLEDGAELTSAASFGFVTSASPEETFERARRRVLDGMRQVQPMVVDESHGRDCVRVRRALVSAPELRSAAFRRLVREVRSLFSEAAVTEREVTLAASAVPATFLYSMLGRLRSPEGRSSGEYMHDGKRFELLCEKSSDPHVGALLAAKNLVRSAASVRRIAGQIRDLETAKLVTFRLWMEEAANLPLRIEFSPRSYLRISLEADPEVNKVTDTEEDT